jgi:hypothetical protein
MFLTGYCLRSQAHKVHWRESTKPIAFRCLQTSALPASQIGPIEDVPTIKFDPKLAALLYMSNRP